MVENDDKQFETDSLFDPLIQTENIAFYPKELLACGGCGRMNPPNRPKCIYCAHDLKIRAEDAVSIAPGFRKLENWERGFNVIFSTRIVGSRIDTATIAKLLSWETDDLAAILEANLPFPIARVESQNEAQILVDSLAQFELICQVVSDADLAADKPPVRLGSIDFHDERLALKTFNTGKVIEIETDELAVIVPGVLASSRVDSIEKKGLRGKTRLIDESATTSDEAILDIYSGENPFGFRVHMAGFDFSCLGAGKGLLAVENLSRLTARLREHAPGAMFVDNYAVIRPALGQIWEIETRKDPKGLMRSGFGKREFGNVSSTSNLNQFTKYSRMLWHIYEGAD